MTKSQNGADTLSSPDERRDRFRPLEDLHEKERIKAASRGLRGKIPESLADPITGGLLHDDGEITKFHGIYQQDDRDRRESRRLSRLEPAYEFMLRVRLPGGVCRPEQWVALDRIAGEHANGTLRLTTRQTFQFHGVLKGALRPTIQDLHATLLDTIGACGDVNRGVMATPLPELDEVHEELQKIAVRVSEHLLPRTRAYHDIWIDGERVEGTDPVEPAPEEEPIYGATYLPRKFKIGFAVPPVNDVDVYTQDIGFIAIVEDGALAGFNVVTGGGMGRTDNDPRTYPRLGTVIGFCAPDRAVEVAEAIVTIQRDFGDRVERKLARFKYTLDRLGVERFTDEFRTRLGWKLEAPRPYRFETSQDRFGWSQNRDGSWNYTLFVENGRVADIDDLRLRSGLRALAKVHHGDFRVTPNQNLILARIPEGERDRIASTLRRYGIVRATDRSELRRHSMACVAFPTCPLAMAEAERYFPHLLTKVEVLFEEVGLADTPIVMRMSGCPNGCSRPYVAEVAFSGRAPGRYNVYLGGGFHGERLNRPYLENVDEGTILDALRALLGRYASERKPGERFGDFTIRKGIVAPVVRGEEFNA